MKRIAFTTVFLLFMCVLQAQKETPVKKEAQEMEVDLPDETEETSILNVKQLQLETSFLINQYHTGKPSYIGQAMLRYGVFKNLEVRLLVEDGGNRDRYIEETVQSTYPFAVSAKMPLVQNHNWLPDITLVAYLKLPVTSRTSKQNAYWSPIILAAFQNKFGDKWKLEYNAGVQQEAYSTTWAWLGNASLHYKLLKPLEIFAEYFAQYQPAAAPEHNVGGGFSYQVNKSLEAYISGGHTVSYHPDNYFMAAGIAFRML